MRFNRGARLDTSRVRDRRGAGRGGMAVGGGIGSIVIVLVILLAGGDPSALLGGDTASQGRPPAGAGLEECSTAGDVETRADCRFVVVENSLQGFWSGEFERRGQRYIDATFTTFTGAVSTEGCGSASSQVGPFYCPADRGVYLDIGFFEILRTQLGGQGGDFAEAYVLAHEYGHHVQNITGVMDQVGRGTGPDSDAVALELQADCYAGVWAHHATTTATDSGQPLITEISREDIAEAVDAAETVGDDYIQERMGGTASPETWTHGSSRQRRQWFERGLRDGDPAGCNTFAAG